jgi:Cu(I)-responsive transcriptional regulator
MTYMNIGQAAAAAGITPKMARHYESLGLIPEAERTDAGYRLYGPREVGMLRFIRQSRDLGFSMKQIEALLSLWRDDRRESREVKQLALAQLAELEERQRELDQMKSTLQHLVEHCAGDTGSHCAILDTLAVATPAAQGERLPRSTPLKHAKPGSHRASRTRSGTERQTVQPAHAALMAWSHSLVRGSVHSA